MSGLAGAAYVFVRTGATWSEQAMLTAADGQSGDALGFSVGIAGKTAFAGEPHRNNLHGQVDLFPL